MTSSSVRGRAHRNMTPCAVSSRLAEGRRLLWCPPAVPPPVGCAEHRCSATRDARPGVPRATSDLGRYIIGALHGYRVRARRPRQADRRAHRWLGGSVGARLRHGGHRWRSALPPAGRDELGPLVRNGRPSNVQRKCGEPDRRERLLFALAMIAPLPVLGGIWASGARSVDRRRVRRRCSMGLGQCRTRRDARRPCPGRTLAGRTATARPARSVGDRPTQELRASRLDRWQAGQRLLRGPGAKHRRPRRLTLARADLPGAERRATLGRGRPLGGAQGGREAAELRTG